VDLRLGQSMECSQELLGRGRATFIDAIVVGSHIYKVRIPTRDPGMRESARSSCRGR
jgi:hypothetical protein